MPKIEAQPGLWLEYESLGDPEAPCILLIMGLGMQLIHWPDHFCQHLVSQGFRVIRFDNRDCGLSTRIRSDKRLHLNWAALASWLGLPLKVPYTLEDMAADCHGLLVGLGILRAHIVGASMGGMIAQIVAARYPERVLSLTSMMSTSGYRFLPKGKPEALRTLFARPENPQDKESVLAHLVRIMGIIGSPAYPTPPDQIAAQYRRALDRAYYPAGVARQLLAILAAKSRRKLLAGIKVPSLVIHGAEDPLIPASSGRDTAKYIPGAQLMIIDGMGHDFPEPLLPGLAQAVGHHCHFGKMA